MSPAAAIAAEMDSKLAMVKSVFIDLLCRVIQTFLKGSNVSVVSASTLRPPLHDVVQSETNSTTQVCSVEIDRTNNRSKPGVMHEKCVVGVLVIHGSTLTEQSTAGPLPTDPCSPRGASPANHDLALDRQILAGFGLEPNFSARLVQSFPIPGESTKPSGVRVPHRMKRQSNGNG